MLDLQRVKVRTQNQISYSSLSELSFRVDGDALGSLGTTLQPADVWSPADPGTAQTYTNGVGAAPSPIHYSPKAGDMEVKQREASMESRFSYNV